ncbi:MAG: mnmA [Proteobacteria bacterium]|nr:mnmA [Pseudomonadota bacterium]
MDDTLDHIPDLDQVVFFHAFFNLTVVIVLDFLYRLNQAQLAKAIFPLGNIYKREVREIAEHAGLHVFDKKDSTGICFIGERPFREFLMRYLPTKPGEIRALDDNRLLGEHQGLMYHTIGQRKGLHIGGIKGNDVVVGEHDAWYVAAKDMHANVLYVVQGHAHPALQRERLVAGDLNWISGRAPRTNWVYSAKPRYRTADQPCEIDSLTTERAEIAFASPQWAVTPGQSVVVYESRVCLGGGIIL